MENKSSLTALMSSFGRAFHVAKDEPIIFNDILSRELMTEEEFQQMKAYMLGGIDFFAPEKKATFSSSDDMLKWIIQSQIAPTPLARSRYCEDALKTAILTGTTQYVILGAGMDTFVYRNSDLMKKLHVFEVDHPLTQAEKQRRIKQAGWDTQKNVTYVAIDFTEGNLTNKLLESGYDKNKKTFFSWLGVSYYLTKEQIENTLQDIASVAVDGSSLVFDYGTEELFTSSVKRVQNMMAMAAASGEPMKSCFSYLELEKILSKYNFLVYEHLSTEDIQKKYFSNRIDYLTAFEHIEYTLTVLKK